MASEDLVVGRFYRSTSVCRSGGQFAFLRRYWKCESITGPLGNPDIADWGIAFDAILAPRYITLMSASAAYYGGMYGRMGNPLPKPTDIIVVSNAGAGTTGTVDAPKQAAGLITLKTGFQGRSNEGRQYVPFPALDFVAAQGVPTAAYITALDALGNVLASRFSFLEIVSGDTIVMSPQIYNVTTHLGREVTTWLSRPAFATQKRRGDYGKLNALPF